MGANEQVLQRRSSGKLRNHWSPKISDVEDVNGKNLKRWRADMFCGVAVMLKIPMVLVMINWLIMMFWWKRCCQKTILKNWPVLWCGRRQRQGRSRRAGSPSPFICSQNFARVGLASKPWFLSKGLASQSVIKILMWIFAVKFWMRCWWCTFSNWWCN